MKLRSQRRERIDAADSGALSDIAFLLIIFFIVIAVFNVNRGFLLGLPAPESTLLVERDSLLRLRIDASGTIVINTGAVDTAELQRALAQARAANPNVAVAARIHPEAPYQSVVDLVATVRGESIDSFSFRMDAQQ